MTGPTGKTDKTGKDRYAMEPLAMPRNIRSDRTAEPPRPRRLPRAALACALAGLCLLAACKDKNAYVPPPPPKVTVATPVRKNVTEYVEFTGNTQAQATVDLMARVEGFLREIDFKDGAVVKKGETLFVIEPEPYQAALDQAKAQIVTQQVLLSQAEIEYERAENLLREKAGPETDVVKWATQRDSAKAGIVQAKAQAEEAAINLGYTRITAPFTGRISRRYVDKGNLVGPTINSKLATIVSVDPIYAYFTLNERELLRLTKSKREKDVKLSQPKDSPVEMGLADEEGYPHKGVMDYADLGLDPNTGTLLLRAVFPNEQYGIMPGMFVRLRAPVGEQNGVLLVDDRALGQNQGGNFLLVVGPDDVVEARPVVIGPKEGDLRVIEKGLKGDERVIVNGLQRARPGSKVEPVAAGAAPAPAGKPTGSPATGG